MTRLDLSRKDLMLAKQIILGQKSINYNTPIRVRKIVRRLINAKRKNPEFSSVNYINKLFYKIKPSQYTKINQLKEGEILRSEIESLKRQRNRLGYDDASLSIRNNLNIKIRELESRLYISRTYRNFGDKISKKKTYDDLINAQKQAQRLKSIVGATSTAKPITSAQSASNAVKYVENTSPSGSVTILKQAEQVAVKAAKKVEKGDSRGAMKMVSNASEKLKAVLVKKPQLAGKIRSRLWILSGVATGASMMARGGMSKSGFIPRSRQIILGKGRQKQSNIQAQQVAQQMKQAQQVEQSQGSVSITIPASTVAVTQATAQSLAYALTGLALTTGFIRYGGGRYAIPPSIKQQGYRGLYRYIYNFIIKKQFVYVPDLYSIIFGIRARAGQRVQLLRKGRIYKGTELRPLIR
jgi:hypothetical protein